MDPTLELSGLIKSLADADSNLERMHVIGLAWRDLRSLSSSEQRALARHAGFEGAEELIRKLAAGRDGIAPAIFLRAIREAREARPGRLKDILSALRGPKSRSRVFLNALSAVTDQLRSEQDGSEEMGQETPDPPEFDAPGIVWEFPSEMEVKETESPPVAGESLPPVPEEYDSENTTPEEHVLEEMYPSPAPEMSSAERQYPDEEREEEESGEDQSTVGEKETPSEAVDPFPPGKEEEGFSEMLTGSGNLLKKLAVLRDCETGDISPEEARRILEVFSSGWARRRAFVHLLKSGGIRKPEVARGLLEIIYGVHNRRWCLHEIDRLWPREVV